jgi:cellulose synthase (UDP-forming)
MSLDDFDEDQLPTIDVAIPSYNEPEALLEITIRAARMLNYPKHKIHIHLLDDGGTDEKIAQANQAAADAALQRRQCLQTLCQRLGVHYHTRARNLNAKAGNINSAMQNMAGDLIVILDADHVPTTDFLSRTVPWMIKDENVFLVQSPHFMANPDTVEKNYFSAFSRMPSENDMFFGIIQKGLDFWSSSFFLWFGCGVEKKTFRSGRRYRWRFNHRRCRDRISVAFAWL